MKRTSWAALVVVLVPAAIVFAAGRGLRLPEIAIILGITVASGVGPFAFGIAVRFLWRHETVPVVVPLVFGLALGVLRLLAPQIGGLTLVDSALLAVTTTAVLGWSYAELGIAAASSFTRWRTRSRAIGNDA